MQEQGLPCLHQHLDKRGRRNYLVRCLVCLILTFSSSHGYSPPGGRLKVEIWVADRLTKMQLKILGVTRADLTSYRCVARNILGQQEGRISLTGETLTL